MLDKTGNYNILYPLHTNVYKHKYFFQRPLSSNIYFNSKKYNLEIRELIIFCIIFF
jgi:hypothetical protein